MTALQFLKRRRKLFPSQNQAAKAMGVAQSTISYWESGFRPVPRYAVKLLECLEKNLPSGDP